MLPPGAFGFLDCTVDAAVERLVAHSLGLAGLLEINSLANEVVE